MDYPSILHVLQQHRNPERALSMAAYMKDRFAFLGVPTPLRRQLCKPFFKAVRSAPVDWDFVERCWACDYRELQYVAIDYLREHQQQLSPSDIPALRRLLQRKSWWDSVDNLDMVVGNIALRHPELDETLLAWSLDEDIWLRRAAIDHQLLRKTRTDTRLLATILRNNLGSQEFFINKAIGWALRDYSKTDPAWVCAFIHEHREQMAALSIREASKYLPRA